jgi:hypothetical protein
MKKLLTILMVVSITTFTVDSFAQGRDVVVGKAFDKNGPGANLRLPDTDVEEPKPDPSRSQCCLNFDNWTGYILNVWVDGTYRGTVSPYGDNGLCVGAGWTTWYARTAGSRFEWSGRGQCRGYAVLKLE